MIYLFDKDEKLFKIVNKPAIKTALQKYTLTTERYVSDRLTVEMKALNDDELEKVEYMAIQTMEDAHTFHYFYVAQKSSENLVTLIGVQSGIEELRKSPVFDKRPQNAFAREVIDDLLAGTNWQARFVGETTPHSTNFYYISTFDALKKVCDIWDLEMQFFVQMNGNQIGARYIDFKQKIGQAVGKRVVYGHNALQILQEVERTNIFTALVGRGKGVQVSSAEDTGAVATGSQGSQAADGYGRKITFEDVVWSTAKGKPVNKPKGQKYLELPAMTKLYGIKNADGSMRPKIGFVEFPEEEDPEVLTERTYKALVDTARPQLTLKTSSVYLRGVKVGDTIRVVRHDKKLDYDTRIFEITFNRLNDQSSDIKLGDRITESQSSRAQIIADKAIDNFVANEFSNFVQNLPDYLPSADGFNNNWYGTEDPTVAYKGKVVINDIWYRPDPEHEGHKIMLRWTGEAWEELVRTYDTEAIRRQVEEVAREGQDIKRSVQTGLAEAKAAGEVFKAQLTAEVASVAREGQAVKATVEAGLAEADRKAQVFEAGIRSRVAQVETKANQVAEQARQADQKAAQALTKAGASESLAQTAKDTADRAIRQAGDNLRTAQERANQLQTELDTAKRSITSQARDILAQAQAQQDLISRVQTVETTANGTKTTVTELSKTLNTATSNLASVTQRVASTETSLAGVRDQYSQLSQTVSGQTGQITAVTRQTADLQRGLDGVTERFEKLKIGGVNLLRNSDFSQGKEHWARLPDVKTEGNTRFVTLPTNLWTMSQSVDVVAGETYTISFYARKRSATGTNPRVSVKFDRHNTETGQVEVTGTDWQRVVLTHQATQSLKETIFFLNRNNIEVDIRHVQVERGNVVTDWSPADEDIRQELATYIRTATENTSRLEQSIQTADGKAEGAKTLAQQTARGLELKAEKSTVDTVAGRLSSAETTIRLQGDQIAQRLTSTQVESAITVKGYQTKDQVDANITGRGYITNAALAGYVPTTSFDNYKTETAQAIERGLTATRALIPTEFSGNILKDGKQVWRNARGATYTLDDDLESDREYTLTVKYWTGTGGQAVSSNVFGHWIVGSYDRTIDAWVIRGRSATKISKGTTFYINAHPATGLGNADWATLTKGPLAMSKYQEPFSNLVTTVDFNRVKETAQLYERVIGQSEGDIQTNVARQVLTSQLYQTEVRKQAEAGENLLVGTGISWEKTHILTDRFGVYTLAYLPNNQTFAQLGFSVGDEITLAFDYEFKTNGNNPLSVRDFRVEGYHTGYLFPIGPVTATRVGGFKSTFRFTTEQQLSAHRLMVRIDNGNCIMVIRNCRLNRGNLSYPWQDRYDDTQALATRVNQLADSYAIQVLGSSSRILTEINANASGLRLTGKLIHLDGTVTASDAFFRSVMADKIEAGNIKAGAVTTAKIAAGAVTADKLVVNQAMIDKLVTNSVWADRLFAQTAFMTKLQAVKIQAGQIGAGLIDTSMLAANAVTADKLVVNQAMIDKLVTNSVWADRLFAQSAFVNKLKAVEVSADRVTTGTLNAANVNIINLNANKLVGLDANFIKAKIETALVSWLQGKVISAQNEAMRINLNQANITFNQNATIDFNSSNNALVRRKGTHTAFVHFNDVSSSSDGGVGSIYASIGVTSSGDGVNSMSSGRFAGLRVFRGARGTAHEATIDQAELYGDSIILKDDFSLGRGFKFNPTTIGGMIDMNYLVGAVRALARCWLHMNNVAWNPQDSALGRAVINEYNNHMKDL